MEGQQVDPTSNPNDGQVDENGNPLTSLPAVITEEIFQDMKNVWSVFDMEESGKVSVDELRTVMRAMDIDVSTE